MVEHIWQNLHELFVFLHDIPIPGCIIRLDWDFAERLHEISIVVLFECAATSRLLRLHYYFLGNWFVKQKREKITKELYLGINAGKNQKELLFFFSPPLLGSELFPIVF